MKDKATRNRQHDFSTGKSHLTNLTVFHSEMADPMGTGSAMMLHTLIFSKAFD